MIFQNEKMKKHVGLYCGYIVIINGQTDVQKAKMKTALIKVIGQDIKVNFAA